MAFVQTVLSKPTKTVVVVLVTPLRVPRIVTWVRSSLPNLAFDIAEDVAVAIENQSDRLTALVWALSKSRLGVPRSAVDLLMIIVVFRENSHWVSRNHCSVRHASRYNRVGRDRNTAADLNPAIDD